MSKGLVSVIITTKNEGKVIERLLESITAQTYKRIEIIVVDNHSQDNTARIAKKYTKAVYQRGPERSVQRNFGAKKANGEYVLFLDADMQLENNVIAECVKVFKSKPTIGAVSIPEISIATTFWERVKAHERSFYNLEGDSTTDAERFFSKASFDAVGGYDETITGPEDWDLPERIKKSGFKKARIKSSIKHFERVPSPFALAKKKYYYALTSHRYLKKHNISAISPKTIYFLRPVFYKNWRMIIAKPVLSLCMFIMFTFELVGGGFGFIVGKFQNL